jgi:hypothetical protein
VKFGLSKHEPVSVAAAREERARVVEQIQEIEGWLGGVGTDSRGPLNAHNYHRQRAERVARLAQLRHRARFLREWLRKHDTENPTHQLLGRCYRALLGLESDEAEALLRDIEAVVPMAALEGR